MATQKQIADSITGIATRHKRTDELRYSDDWLYWMIDITRADIATRNFAQNGVLDMTLLSDLGVVNFHEVNIADNISVTCNCPISKATIPQFLSLYNGNVNQDLGIFQITSVCEVRSITPLPISRWRNVPLDHPMANFTYYFRINTQLYLSKVLSQARIIGALLHPAEGKLTNSAPVASGSLVNGTVYYVSTFGGSIIYANVSYAPGTTFTAGATATFTTTNGIVYLNSQIASYRDTDQYPASGDMIRQIELEILTKEFNIEKAQLTDVRNDSVDDANKTVSV